MGLTPIEWTDRTWSPLRVRVKVNAAAIAEQKGYTSLVQIASKMAGHVGPHCELVSPGCKFCYSDTNNGRCLPANGTGLPFDRRSRDLVDPFVDEKILCQPIKWRKPQRIFVENQSDLFGAWVTDEMRDRAFAVMAYTDRHTYQVLTKRAKEMRDYLTKDPAGLRERIAAALLSPHFPFGWGDPRKAVLGMPSRAGVAEGIRGGWRLPVDNHVWLGVSVESPSEIERVQYLLESHAGRVKFVSYEPALEYVDWEPWLRGDSKISWVIIGGESGTNARPFNAQWAFNAIALCKKYSTPVFMKQFGAVLYSSRKYWDIPHEVRIQNRIVLKDRKGGKSEEWPDWARVRQMPV